MSESSNDTKVAFLMANSGVEQVELTEPWKAVVRAGWQPILVAPEAGTVQAFNHDVEPGDTFPVDVVITDADVADYAALVLPGGTTNPDKLRIDKSAVQFVAGFAAAGKPIAGICHGPWTLVEADLVGGRTVTSWPSLRTDIGNAGGNWVDAEVQVCTSGSFPLVTSRKPGDLEAFCAALVDQVTAAI